MCSLKEDVKGFTKMQWKEAYMYNFKNQRHARNVSGFNLKFKAL